MVACLITLVTINNVVAQIATGYQVEIRPIPDAIPLGSSVILDYTLINSSAQELPLRMGVISAPDGLIQVFDKSGKREGTVMMLRDTGPRFPPAENAYRTKPGERLRFTHDLNLLYSGLFSQPGKHEIRFISEQGVIASTEIEAVEYEALQSREFSASYLPPQIHDATNSLKLHLDVVKSRATADPRYWMLIDRIEWNLPMGLISNDRARERVRRGEGPLSRYALRLPSECTIESAEMDHLGQAWIVLNGERGSALLVWRTHHLNWSVLIASTKSKIDLGTTRGRLFVPDVNMVIAGIDGQEKFTTQWLWHANLEPTISLIPDD
jgi:hypothetical protein